MILSFWRMSFELFRELLRWMELGGAKDAAAFSRFCEELLREGMLRKLAVDSQKGCMVATYLAAVTYLVVTHVAPRRQCVWSPWTP